MIRLKILLFFSAFLFLNSSLIFSQSDYEVVQNFKKSYQQLEKRIDNAGSESELQGLNSEIDKLGQEYRDHRSLLDKSLYPENLNSSIEKLKNKVETARNDRVQVNDLKTEVVLLKLNVDSISRKNSDLLSQLQILEAQSKQDKSRIAQLEKSIAELKASLRKRDELVMNMIDSLMPPSVRYQDELSSEEKQDVYSEAKKKNLVANIKSAINDNIKFLEITSLNFDDVKEVKKQQSEFAKVWQSSGPKIVDIYAEKGEDINHLADIDQAFTKWNDAIEKEAWTTIHSRFEVHNITLKNFSDGESFTSAVTSYIDDKMKSGDKNNYTLFTDSVWNKSMKSDWLPFLISNNMLTDDQADRIDDKISEWDKEEQPGNLNWLWILIALIVIAVVVILIMKRKPKERIDEENSE